MRTLSKRHFRIAYFVPLILIILGAIFPVPLRVKSESISKQPLNQSSEGQIFLPLVSQQRPVEISWSTLGANPERTSWTPEQVDGRLKPLWFKKFEPYIPQKVQIITAYNTLYISTAAGLYALDAATGSEKWVYPTEMPLGHSPTVKDGVVYVGGMTGGCTPSMPLPGRDYGHLQRRVDLGQIHWL